MFSEKRVVQVHQSIARGNGNIATVMLQLQLLGSKIQSQ